MSRFTIHHGKVLDVVATYPDNHFDAVFSDVPYGLGSHQPTPEEILAYLTGAELATGGDFMAKDWHVPSVETWRQIYRVLKPGAHGLIFAGPRTADLISVGMRFGGFEVRDTICWLFASGFPKSLDASKALDEMGFARRWSGYGTAIKPAYEPIIVARKPLDGTVAENIEKWEAGAIAIDNCRVGFERLPAMTAGQARIGTFERSEMHTPERTGRWPANVVLSHADECVLIGTRKVPGHKGYPNGPGGSSSQLSQKGTPTTRKQPWAGHAGEDGAEVVEDWACIAGCPIRILDAQSGNRRGMSGGGKHREGYGGGLFGGIDSTHTARNDNGGASRFFFCGKASRRERDLGCEHLPRRSAAATVEREEGSAALNSPRTGAGRTSGARNHHPTVKPVKLDEYLAKLPLPPPRVDGSTRRIFIPYAGSGTEVIGALLAGWDEVVAVEMDEEYIPILQARATLAETNPRAFDEATKRATEKAAKGQMGLFETDDAA